MAKKFEGLRRVVQKLEARYGQQDPDVLRLKQELAALEAAVEVKAVERRKVQVCRYTFGSVAKQHFLAARQAPRKPSAGVSPG